jgi:hypothetical protein
MYGRLSLLLTLVPVFLLFKINNKYLLIVLFVSLFLPSVLKVTRYSLRKVPYILEREYLQNNLSSSTLIISNYEEPYLNGLGDLLILNSPKTEIEEVKGKIENSLKKGKKVLITSQALTAPYFQYDGMDLQILSKRKNLPLTQGRQLVNNYQLEVFKEITGTDLRIFSLIGQQWYSFSPKESFFNQ